METRRETRQQQDVLNGRISADQRYIYFHCHLFEKRVNLDWALEDPSVSGLLSIHTNRDADPPCYVIEVVNDARYMLRVKVDFRGNVLERTLRTRDR